MHNQEEKSLSMRSTVSKVALKNWPRYWQAQRSKSRTKSCNNKSSPRRQESLWMNKPFLLGNCSKKGWRIKQLRLVKSSWRRTSGKIRIRSHSFRKRKISYSLRLSFYPLYEKRWQGLRLRLWHKLKRPKRNWKLNSFWFWI